MENWRQGVSHLAPRLTADGLARLVREEIARQERRQGMPCGAARIEVDALSDANGIHAVLRRRPRNDEEMEPPSSSVSADPYQGRTEEVGREIIHRVNQMVEQSRTAYRRETAWNTQEGARTPLWVYSMHPLHRRLIGDRLPDASHLHPHRPGPHRIPLPGTNCEHGDQEYQRRQATLSAAHGVIIVERAALHVGGVPIEIGTGGRQVWLRIPSSLPETLRTSLEGQPVGRIVQTGHEDADGIRITAVVAGVRGDRLILDDILTPLEGAPTGVDEEWRHRRYGDIADRFRRQDGN